MKRLFYKYLFAIVITLGGVANLCALPHTTFVHKSSEEHSIHFYNSHKQLPTTHRTQRQSKISFFETVESEDSETSKNKQKPSSIQAKHNSLLAKLFFNSLLKNADIPQNLQSDFSNLVKIYACKIHIQYEVFRI